MEQPSEFVVPDTPAWDKPIVLLPGFVLLAAVGGLFPSFSLPANLYVLVIGGTMLWLGLFGRLPRRPAPRRLDGAAGWWLLPALTLAFVELVTFAGGSTYHSPTLSLLSDPVLESYLPRAALYFGWLTAFWGLVRR